MRDSDREVKQINIYAGSCMLKPQERVQQGQGLFLSGLGIRLYSKSLGATWGGFLRKV